MFRRDSMSVKDIQQAASSWPSSADEGFADSDVETIMTHMETANKVMIHDGMVHLI